MPVLYELYKEPDIVTGIRQGELGGQVTYTSDRGKGSEKSIHWNTRSNKSKREAKKKMGGRCRRGLEKDGGQKKVAKSQTGYRGCLLYTSRCV